MAGMFPLPDGCEPHKGSATSKSTKAKPIGSKKVHAYEQWRDAFGDHVPRLLAARDTAPYALVVTELPGQIVKI
ncbi:MAG: hypothetical protein R3E31_15945 [Chloroflexota bacterium]